MPKGRTGCFICGEPTTERINFWLREYGNEIPRIENYVRVQRTAMSTQRSYCALHAQEIWDKGVERVDMPRPTYHGCVRCGTRGVWKIQLWRVQVPRNQSIATLSRTFCEPCGNQIWKDLCVISEAATYRRSKKILHGTDLAEARHKWIEKVETERADGTRKKKRGPYKKSKKKNVK